MKIQIAFVVLLLSVGCVLSADDGAGSKLLGGGLLGGYGKYLDKGLENIVNDGYKLGKGLEGIAEGYISKGQELGGKLYDPFGARKAVEGLAKGSVDTVKGLGDKIFGGLKGL